MEPLSIQLEDEPEFSELCWALRNTFQGEPGANDRVNELVSKLVRKGYDESGLARAVSLGFLGEVENEITI